MCVGSTQGDFRHYRSGFAHEIYKHRTNLSNYVREVKKKQGTGFILKWEIIKNAESKRLVIDITSYVWRKSQQELLIITPMNCSIRNLKY